MDVGEYFEFGGVVYVVVVVGYFVGNYLVVVCVVYLVFDEWFDYVVFLSYVVNLFV